MNKKTKILKDINYKFILIKIIRIVLISYFTILVFLVFTQKSMLYYPDYPRESNFYDCPFYEDNEKKEYKNTRFYERKGEKNNVIVFFHGNAGGMCDREVMKELLLKTGNSIIFVEYYGYSDGPDLSPDIGNILKDVENIGEYVNSKDYDKTYVVGRSVGSGPASYYSINFETEKLALFSPYSQLYKVASKQYPFFPIKYLFTQNYNNEEYLENYKNELLIIHGEKDRIVPFEFGEELYLGVDTEKKEFLKVIDGDHNDLLYYEEVNQKIRDFLK